MFVWKKIVTLKDVIILSEKRRQVFEKRRFEGKTHVIS